MMKQRSNRFGEKPDGQTVLRCAIPSRLALTDAKKAFTDLAEKAIQLEVLEEVIHQANGPSDRFLQVWKKPVESMGTLARILLREHEGVPLAELVQLGYDGYFVSGRPMWDRRKFKNALRKAIQRRDPNVESKKSMRRSGNDPHSSPTDPN
jgi:hypothetical protein